MRNFSNQTMTINKNLKIFLGTRKFDQIKSFKLLNGGRNNQVIKVKFKNDEIIIFKNYFHDKDDNHQRLKNEWTFLKYAQKLNLNCVPIPINQNTKLNMASYTFIEGDKIISNSFLNEDIIKCAKFILKINKSNVCRNFSPASEYCTSLESHQSNINKRVFGLSNKIDQSSKIGLEISNFLIFKIMPLWKKIKKFNFKNTSKLNKNFKLFLSPSDFGFHNILKNSKSELFFLDFEYAGFDDLAKLCNDFFYSSQNKIKVQQRENFIKYIEQNIMVDDYFRSRVESLEFSYRLKWLCIMINRFTKQGLLKENFRGNHKNEDNQKENFRLIRLLFDDLEKDFLFYTS